MNKRLQDKRYQKTATKIHHALAALLEQQPTMETTDVTIQELCEQAGVTRGTFYRHYKSISAVVAEAERYLYDEYLKVLYSTPDPERQPKPLVRSILELVGENKAYFRMVFARNDYHLMFEALRVTRPLLQDAWRKLPHQPDRMTLDKIYYFSAYGVIGLLKHWVIEHDCDCRLTEEYVDFICEYARAGMSQFVDTPCD